jgi:nucleoside-diphosphate-sugar epimerase
MKGKKFAPFKVDFDEGETMKVFLTGATGYIGSAVAEALQRAGHEVSGLARSDEAASKLEAAGLHALHGDLHDAESLAAAARAADAVIHTASTNGPDMPQTDRQAVEAIIAALAGTNKPFIYTSGIWVLGDTGERVADEESPLDPTPLVAWRPAVEELALKASERGVRSVVIRPGMVYGRGGGMVAPFIKSAREGSAPRYVGTGENRWPLVHVEDLADLYVKALEAAPPATLLLAVHGPSLRVREIAEAASRSAGADGRTESWPLDEARKTLGPYADALALDQQVSAERSKRLLQWSPRAPTLLEDLASGSYAG